MSADTHWRNGRFKKNLRQRGDKVSQACLKKRSLYVRAKESLYSHFGTGFYTGLFDDEPYSAG